MYKTLVLHLFCIHSKWTQCPKKSLLWFVCSGFWLQLLINSLTLPSWQSCSKVQGAILKLVEVMFYNSHISNISHIDNSSLVVMHFPVHDPHNGTFRDQTPRIKQAYVMAYRFFGIYSLIPILLSLLFSVRICLKIEKDSPLLTQMMALTLSVLGLYPQYSALK